MLNKYFNFFIHFTSDEERIKSFDNIKLLKRKESFVIPNGVDITIKRKNTDIRGDLKIDKKAFLLLFIGRINKKKNRISHTGFEVGERQEFHIFNCGTERR
ncbi:MAG: hypothetical protein QXI58_04490 [Candidatus Micrarchaeia archaeon]